MARDWSTVHAIHVERTSCVDAQSPGDFVRLDAE